MTNHTARMLLDLFPRLSLGLASLSVGTDRLSTTFFEELAERACGLRSLDLDSCDACRGHILRVISGLRGLRELSLTGGASQTEEADVDCLTSLTKLTRLSFGNVSLGYGLDVLVPHLPCLQSLEFHWVSFTAPVRLSSGSLQTLVLNSALPSGLDRASLPALKQVSLRSLYLEDIAGSNAVEDAELVSKVHMVSCTLAAFPLRMHPVFGLGCNISERIPLTTVMMLVAALKPLNRPFLSVTQLDLVGMDCGPGVFAELSGLFPNLRQLLLVGASFHGLVEAVENFKGLELLSVDVDGIPTETLAVLLTAGKAGRRFSLELTPTSEECEGQLFMLSRLWEPAKHLFSSVTLSAY